MSVVYCDIVLIQALTINFLSRDVAQALHITLIRSRNENILYGIPNSRKISMEGALWKMMNVEWRREAIHEKSAMGVEGFVNNDRMGTSQDKSAAMWVGKHTWAIPASRTLHFRLFFRF